MMYIIERNGDGSPKTATLLEWEKLKMKKKKKKEVFLL